jgi:hypothetical protein
MTERDEVTARFDPAIGAVRESGEEILKFRFTGSGAYIIFLPFGPIRGAEG